MALVLMWSGLAMKRIPFSTRKGISGTEDHKMTRPNNPSTRGHDRMGHKVAEPKDSTKG